MKNDEQGPGTTYDWVQNVTAPTQAPEFTRTPNDPQTSLFGSANPFNFAPNNLALSYQCRVTEPGQAFEDCSTLGIQTDPLANGTYNIEVRAINRVGEGPIANFTLNKEVPNPRSSIPLDDVTSVTWGPSPSDAPGNIGASSVGSAGDVNGDGRDDLVARSSVLDTFVLFTPRNGTATPDNQMGPAQGYKIVTDYPDPFGTFSYAAEGIGDQNGDGVPDLLLTQPDANGFGYMEVYVVYGIKDPSILPKCVSGQFNLLRCQDLTDMSPSEGYRLTDGGLEYMGAPAAGSTDLNQPLVTGIGDVNGDSIEDMLLGAPYASDVESLQGAAWVVMGGREAPDDGEPVDVFSLPESEAIRIEGHGDAVNFAGNGGSVGDLDQDGLGDFVLYYTGKFGQTSDAYVFLGKGLEGSPIRTDQFGPENGFRVVVNPLTASPTFGNVGDLNADGREDLMVGAISFIADDSPLNVYFTPETLPGAGLSSNYTLTGKSLGGQAVVNGIQNVGDYNGDGVPDQAVGSQAATVDGVKRAGAALITFGRSEGPTPNSPIKVDSNPEASIVLQGNPTFEGKTGYQVFGAGDQDGDDLGDFWVANKKATMLVTSKRILPAIQVNQPGNLAGISATLNAAVSNTRGEGEAWFEWGTTAEYGSSTAPQAVDGTSSVKGDLTGLTPNTAYHYRLVVKNGGGVTKYGEDQTFNSGPVYDHCKAVPTDCKSSGEARLALIATNKKIAVKRGKRGVLRVAVVNTGGEVANGVKVCAKVPKRHLRVKRCFKVGKLGSGKTRVVAVKVQAKRKAKRGKKVLSLAARGNNVSAKKTKVRVVIR